MKKHHPKKGARPRPAKTGRQAYSRYSLWIGVFLLIIISTLQGCATTVTKEEAATTALQFVRGRVRFFPSGENSSSLVQTTVKLSPDSYEETGFYVIILHAEATKDNKTVKNDFTIDVDKGTGVVLRVNGQPVGKAP
ncbi:MAG: hypothetical protein GXP63_01765 [DPANN group archaeon]|nr:hypothetical protein [DPANN group archaeon]